jgi:hypothetical protein
VAAFAGTRVGELPDRTEISTSYPRNLADAIVDIGRRLARNFRIKTGTPAV